MSVRLRRYSPSLARLSVGSTAPPASSLARLVYVAVASILSGLAGGSVLADPPDARIAWMRQTPLVITPNTSELTIEAGIEGKVEEARFYFNQQEVPLALNDAGRAGDQLAGDGIYTLRLNAAEIRRALRPADVFRADLGVVRLYREGKPVGHDEY